MEQARQVQVAAGRMDPEVKARWVAALRSGEYKQTKRALRLDGGHCCLGVLCDLYAKEHGFAWEHTADLEGENAGLPNNDVCKWAGITANERVEIDGERARLYDHNDGAGDTEPRTFAQIADAIEAQL